MNVQLCANMGFHLRTKLSRIRLTTLDTTSVLKRPMNRSLSFNGKYCTYHLLVSQPTNRSNSAQEEMGQGGCTEAEHSSLRSLQLQSRPRNRIYNSWHQRFQPRNCLDRPALRGKNQPLPRLHHQHKQQGKGVARVLPRRQEAKVQCCPWRWQPS